MNLKLQTKITFIYAIVFTLVLIGINAAVLTTVKFFNNNRTSAGLVETEQKVEKIISNKPQLTREVLRDEGIYFPFVVKVKSNEMDFISQDGIELDLNSSHPSILVREKGAYTVHSVADISREFISSDKKSYSITVIKSIESENYNRKVTAIVSSIASIFGMIISVIVGNYLSHQTLSPIVNMRKSVENIKASNMHDRIKIPQADDELKELGITFNKMLDRLDDAYTKQAKFVSDASHELRTPLTVIKGYVDMLIRWGKKDPEILDESITAIKEETDNMRVLVENLLFIARGENKKIEVRPEKFNLLELAAEITEESNMNQRKRDFKFEGDSFDITADRKMIKQLIRIFIDNSIKFTPEMGLIKTTVKQDGNFAIIEIYDEGDGISPEDIGKVFERFYIADKARTKDKSGTGLGLSIAKWIVEVHHGSVKVESELSKYTRFIVRIPVEFTASSK